MNIEEVKDNIALLLNNIRKRFEMIDRQHAGKALLETDLMMEDIRLLYRETDLLRKLSEAEVNTGRNSRERNYQDTNAEVPLRREPEAQAAAPRAHDPVSEQQPTPVAQQPAPLAQQPAQAPQQPTPARQEQPQQPTPAPQQPVAAPEQQPESINHIPDPVAPATPPPPVREPLLQHTPPPAPPLEQQPLQQSFVAEQYHKPAPAVVHPAPTPPVREKAPAPVEKKRNLVGERFSNEKNSVHERLAQIRDDKSIGMRLQFKPVTNIREAIGLNEKFLFINELFSGDINAYNDAVNNLNSKASVHEAFELLNILTEDFKWDGQRSADTIEKFANLVQRRFM
jgi:hypothetical protein